MEEERIELPVLNPGPASAIGLPAEPLAPGRRGEPDPGRKPPWLKIQFRTDPGYLELKQLMRGLGLHTVCEEARCPNIYECWGHRTATFMINGGVCTRACGFCAVASGRPLALDPEEPLRLAEAVLRLGLRHVVITAVARDDLPDGGAAAFAACIREVRRRSPGTAVEVLIPDFQGDREALAAVLAAGPDILNHNVETVERLTPRVRAKATYRRSLELLARSKELAPGVPTKSGLMLGLGETWGEVVATLRDLRAVGVDIVTIGQYLRPTPRHLPVVRYVHPEEFARLREVGLEMGFRHVESGPLVRSSYHAHAQSEAARLAGAGAGHAPLRPL